MNAREALRRVRRLGNAQGRRQLAATLARRAEGRLGPDLLSAYMRPEDLADPARAVLPVPAERPPRTRPLEIAWVTTPPGPGSGGHTTMFRMVEALESAGHRCRIVLYDPYNPTNTDLAARRAIIRASWPRVRADVRGLADGLVDVDAAIATAWQTAHALARHGGAPMRRLYFVQDFEPLFYPRGAESALAELSYGFGFRTIALGHMVAGHLRRELELEPDVLPFGCDTEVYRPLGRADRRGVVFYTVPGAARRGFLLTVLALERFHALHPEQPIHAYGGHERMRLPFPVVWHGRVRPTELNALYNQARAGLAMSFTNISLVAEELLAAGCVPVVNDSTDARADLPSAHVVWTRPSPEALARALSALVMAPDAEARAAAAAADVRRGWGPAQRGIVDIVENEVYRP